MTRTLIVEVGKAKNILSVNKKAGHSDPFCSVSLEDIGGREIKNEKFHTKVVNKTLSPEWNEQFIFGNSYNLNTSGELPALVVNLFHKGGLLQSDEPMGRVTVPLDTIDASGNSSAAWYPLVGDARLKFQASGEIFMKIKFSGPPTDGEDEVDVESQSLLAESEDPEFSDQPPNEVNITINQARNIQIMDKNLFSSGGSSDPYVKLRVHGMPTQKTKVIKKSLAPVWNEKFIFAPVTDESQSIELTLYDQDTLTSKFMGRVGIPLGPFADKKPAKKWYSLYSEEGVNDGVNRGQLEVTVQWKFSRDTMMRKAGSNLNVSQAILGATDKLGAVFRGDFGGADSEEEDDGDEPAEVAEEVKEETKAEKEAQQKAAEERMKEISEVKIEKGDYQIQVHLIECRDLKGENFDGTSDPVIYVELFKQKQNTSVKYSCTSCVFDELLIFDIKNVEKEAFEEAIIRIACYDSNTIGRNKMIGAWCCDATMVYFQKDHEYYRKWVPLMDDEDPDDVGVQGYLKCSVIIIGPKDKQKVHDEDAEKREELAKENACGGDIGSLVVTPPTMRKEWVFMVATIYKAEALTVMDGKVSGIGVTLSKAGTDAFVAASFGGAKEIKTRVKTCKGTRAAMNPEFNYELWYPVAVPTMTQLLKLAVYDDDVGGAEMIGICFEKFSRIDKLPSKTTPLTWVNIYGAPEDKTGGVISNVAKAAKAAKDVTEQLVVDAIDYHQLYNTVSDRGSTFKGRLLCKFAIKTKRPEKYESDEISPFRRKIPKLTPKQLPPSADYVLQALVVSGNDLPAFTPISITAVGGKKQDLRVKITIGHHELCTKPGNFNNGVVNWQEKLVSDTIKLPLDLTQIPDIIVYLVREDNKNVCFSRMKPYFTDDETKEKKLLGFMSPAKWVLLQEDKVFDHLDDGEFPGSVLVKLGFGLASECKSPEVVSHWNSSFDAMKIKEPYEVRVHVYQAKELEASDGNGLSDPYVKISFMGKAPVKTSIKKETLYPGFYESFAFDCQLPVIEYAPQVCFKIFDHDLHNIIGEGDLLGCCCYDLSKAIITLHNEVDSFELPDPIWYDLYKEIPGDGEGSLLVLVQLIKKTSPTQVLPAIPKNFIKPAMRKAFLDIVLVGAREMAPFNFLPMQSPYLHFQLDSAGKKYVVDTAPSKRPNPSNPNFLERIVLPVDLPEKAVFASPLSIRAHDVRLGGFLKPEVGAGVIPMVPKIPWWPHDIPHDDTPNPPTFVPPQSQVFFAAPIDMIAAKDAIQRDLEAAGKGVELLDVTGAAVKKLSDTRQDTVEADDYVETMPPANVETFVQARMAKDETGAGVFGALRHIKMQETHKKKIGEDAFTDPDWTQDDSDQPPAWSVGRKTLQAELEEDLKTTPFETYLLRRGNKNGVFGSTLKTVGKVKGLVRVMRNEDDPPILPKEILDDLFRPKLYKVRLYVLRGVSLAKMDIGLTGKPEASDPYLIVNLGSFLFNDRQNAVEDATDVDFYKMVEFDAELPGTSQLKINVMDKDVVGSDDLIGKTTIDLEDRWFDNRWQEWGRENRVTEAAENGVVRFDTKPVEARTLFLPGKSSSQGVLTCWLDILRPEEATFFPPDDVALPPTRTFEVRLVIWKSKNVPNMDELEGMSDLYVKAWPEGCSPQETDTHWRCKKGKASWNWRMLFDVELGHNTRAMKFPFLHVQLWDRDLLKYNDCAGEVHLNLERYYRKAYKRNIAIKLFEKKKGAAAIRDRKKKPVAPPLKVEETTEDIPPPETDADRAAVAARYEADLAKSALAPTKTVVDPPVKSPIRGVLNAADSDDENLDETGKKSEIRDVGLGAIPAKPVAAIKPVATIAAAPKQATPIAKDKAVAVTEPASKGWFSWGSKEEEEEEPLLEEEHKDDAEKEKDQDDEDMKDLVSQIKSMTGLYDEDPEDSEWLHFEQEDKNKPGKPKSMGYVAYSLQIWPKDKALVMPVGSARNDPNNNPYLPPPVGRLKFSWNPFVLGSELCGPKLCAYLTCCIICAGFLCLMIFAQPFLMILINVLFFFA